MKMNFKTMAAMVLCGLTLGSCTAATEASSVGSTAASTQDVGSGVGNVLNSLFGGGGDSTLGNILEGVLSTSKLTVADLAGQWTSTGSAVAFKSENFLAQAGGLAAAATIESKINPYFEKYGLTGAVFTIQSDGNFTLQVKKMTLSGVITQSQDGNFIFTFSALGAIPIGQMETYISKSINSMDIMFDATKLKSIMKVAAQFSGSTLASTATSLLDSYDGLCVGFKVKKTGTAPAVSTQQTEQSEQSGSSLLERLLGR